MSRNIKLVITFVAVFLFGVGVTLCFTGIVSELLYAVLPLAGYIVGTLVASCLD